MKIIINQSFGSFGFSYGALKKWLSRQEPGLYYLSTMPGYLVSNIYEYDTHKEVHHKSLRTDPYMIELVEEDPYNASGPFAKLKVIEIPDDIEYYVQDNGGLEIVQEAHRSWD